MASDSRGFASFAELLAWCTPRRSARWGDLEVTGVAPWADYVAVITTLPPGVLYKLVPPHKRIYVRTEPLAYLREWPISRWTRSARLASLFAPALIIDHATQARPAPAFWHVGLDYDTLRALPPSNKSRNLSCIVSTKSWLPGHRERLRFVDQLCQRRPADFDLYGHGLEAGRFADCYRGPLRSRRASPWGDACKLDGLLDYRYSLCLENAREENYYSEKIVDAWLTWTVPIYSGCPNLGDYYPSDSFIAIDVTDPAAVDRVLRQIAEPPSRRTIEAIGEARRLALDVYGLLPALDAALRQRLNG